MPALRHLERLIESLHLEKRVHRTRVLDVLDDLGDEWSLRPFRGAAISVGLLVRTLQTPSVRQLDHVSLEVRAPDGFTRLILPGAELLDVAEEGLALLARSPVAVVQLLLQRGTIACDGAHLCSLHLGLHALESLLNPILLVLFRLRLRAISAAFVVESWCCCGTSRAAQASKLLGEAGDDGEIRLGKGAHRPEMRHERCECRVVRSRPLGGRCHAKAGEVLGNRFEYSSVKKTQRRDVFYTGCPDSESSVQFEARVSSKTHADSPLD